MDASLRASSQGVRRTGCRSLPLPLPDPVLGSTFHKSAFYFHFQSVRKPLSLKGNQQRRPRSSSPSKQLHKIIVWLIPILILVLSSTNKDTSTSYIQLSSTSIQGLITLLRDTWSVFWIPLSKPLKNNSATFSGTLLRILNKGELLPLLFVFWNSTNLVGDHQVAMNHASPFANA
ncbi:hypothetical protein M5K25_017501 [Dendrobium thyrsiflorum]|uniref:Uncharacterized protein n=1 Tax=Dendrobium thyrsiflorum TaxID=117978 RepID=A0ABD0UMY3_DENTH